MIPFLEAQWFFHVLWLRMGPISAGWYRGEEPHIFQWPKHVCQLEFNKARRPCGWDAATRLSLSSFQLCVGLVDSSDYLVPRQRIKYRVLSLRYAMLPVMFMPPLCHGISLRADKTCHFLRVLRHLPCSVWPIVVITSTRIPLLFSTSYVFFMRSV